jgi:hypothetical protein
LSKYLQVFLGIPSDKNSFKELSDFLNSNTSKENRVLVSDRSPKNWVIGDNAELTILDLGLVRLGGKEEDWIWFIDSPSIKTDYNREQLIDFYLLNEENDMSKYEDKKRRFHFSAVYLNILQMCFLYKKDKNASEYAYNKALESAQFLGNIDMVYEIRKIKSSFTR